MPAINRQCRLPPTLTRMADHPQLTVCLSASVSVSVSVPLP
eukprot:COSAG02_NODE_64869_length_259_cov_0.900000_1_plen_40_part_01